MSDLESLERSLTTDWTRQGVKRRVQKKRITRMRRRVPAYEKRCRGLHRTWTFAAVEWNRWGTIYWPLKQMHRPCRRQSGNV